MRLRSGKKIRTTELEGHKLEEELIKSPPDSLIQSDSEASEVEPSPMATLKQLAELDLIVQPLAITFPTQVVPPKLNYGFLNLLPKFHGRLGEDLYRHISKFIVTCSTMHQEEITEENVKLRAFPFSLQDATKDWLYYKQAGSITSWNQLHKAFLEKYFPTSHIGSIRKEICYLKQNSRELYEYWERFNNLCPSCPMHKISDQLLV